MSKLLVAAVLAACHASASLAQAEIDCPLAYEMMGTSAGNATDVVRALRRIVSAIHDKAIAGLVDPVVARDLASVASAELFAISSSLLEQSNAQLTMYARFCGGISLSEPPTPP